jgi:pimeloyl-ACP methyl ester carboxylesterase
VTADWDTSLDLVESLSARDGAEVVGVNRTRLLSHGSKAPRAVVLLHGFTNAPVQFREIADAYFALGDNVLIPRVPAHGLTDPFAHELSILTPELLGDFCDDVVDAAAGLGDTLLVVGLSLGGLLAGHMAKMRDEVSSATLISPFIQPKAMPLWASGPFDAAMRALPDVYSWWNPKLQEVEVAGTYATPKFSMKAVAAQISFARDTEKTASPRTTRLERVLLIVNEADIAVRNDVARTFVAEQLEPIADEVVLEVIEKSYGFTHDVIEPNGDNREKMDEVRDRLWPVLGLTPPPHGSLKAPTPGGGYFPEKGPWADVAAESEA